MASATRRLLPVERSTPKELTKNRRLSSENWDGMIVLGQVKKSDRGVNAARPIKTMGINVQSASKVASR